jgi:hypothetical protein
MLIYKNFVWKDFEAFHIPPCPKIGMKHDTSGAKTQTKLQKPCCVI